MTLPPFLITGVVKLGTWLIWLYRAYKQNCPGCNEGLAGCTIKRGSLHLWWCVECVTEGRDKPKVVK